MNFTLISTKTLQILFMCLLSVTLIAISLIQILNTPSPMYWDQKFLNYTFQQNYPKLEQGIPQFWIAGLIQNNGKIEENSLNTILRLVAASIYLFSACVLGWSIRGKGGALNFSLWMILLFTSGLQFIWLSSELLAGAFLMLFLLSVIKKWSIWIEAILLLLFGLTKPDLFFVSVCVWGYLSFVGNQSLRSKLLHMYLFIGFVILALLPGILQNGIDYLKQDGRSINSLGQHYAALINPLQITANLPEPWQYYGIYVTSTWGSANNAFTLIISNPSRFVDFIFLSLATTLKRLISGSLLFYLPAAIISFKHLQDRKIKSIILLCLLNFIPILLLAFFHIRYGARFLPLALFTIFYGIDQIQNLRLRKIVYGSMWLIIIIQIPQFLNAFKAGYWLVD